MTSALLAVLIYAAGVVFLLAGGWLLLFVCGFVTYQPAPVYHWKEME